MDGKQARMLEAIAGLQPTPKTAMVGFDAVVDTLSRPIQAYTADKSPVYFRAMADFGQHLIEKAGLSCCVQMERITEKMGGNMPILSAGLLGFGVSVSMLGAVEGIREQPVFQSLRDVPLYPVTKPGHCTALEFANGKVMLADRGVVDFSWQELQAAIEEPTLRRLLTAPDLLCLVNWSEMLLGNEVWGGIVEMLLEDGPQKDRCVLLDLADCSAHAPEELRTCIAHIRSIASVRRTVLSMNKNEAILVAGAIGVPVRGELVEWGEALAGALALDATVIHTNTSSMARFAGEKAVICPSFHTKTPAILTGGGDNFNAGLCFGLLHGLDADCCLLLANANSGYYVRNGGNTDIEGLLAFIRHSGRE